MVQTECVTDQQVMGLDARHLHDLVLADPELHQGYLSKQGQHGRCGGYRYGTFVPWELLIMHTQRQTDLPLDDAVDQQPNDREHRQGGNALG